MSLQFLPAETPASPEMRAELVRLRAEISHANRLLLSAWKRFDEVKSGDASPAILASSGISLAAERLQSLYRREADAEARLRSAYAAATHLTGPELDCLIEAELASMN